MTRIVVLGDVMVDVVARLSGPLAPASDAPAAIRFHGGGSAANAAAWLAAAGDSRCSSAASATTAGRQAREELRAGGVDARLAVDPELPPGPASCWSGPTASGRWCRTRAPTTHSGRRTCPTTARPGGHLHVAGYALLREGSRAAARAAIRAGSRAGMSVSVDPSSSALLSAAFLDWAAGAGLLLPNAAGGRGADRRGRPGARGARLAARFDEVVVTLGAEGALWTDGAELCACRRARERVTDSTGAGDAFAAGLQRAVAGARGGAGRGLQPGSSAGAAARGAAE